MSVKQVIAVRIDLGMSPGKVAAQVGHAANMLFCAQIRKQYQEYATIARPAIALQYEHYDIKLDEAEELWAAENFTKAICAVHSKEQLEKLMMQAVKAGILVHPVVDNGVTEFNGEHHLTCAAFGPDYCEKLDSITGRLPLLKPEHFPQLNQAQSLPNPVPDNDFFGDGGSFESYTGD